MARPEGDATSPPWTGYFSTDHHEPRDRLWLGTVLTKINPDQTLYPDASNPRVTSRAGPPDDAWVRDEAARTGKPDLGPPWFLR